MDVHDMPALDVDTMFQNFVAELTTTAYGVALRHRTGSSWVDLELDLWEALKETVGKRRKGYPGL